MLEYSIDCSFSLGYSTRRPIHKREDFSHVNIADEPTFTTIEQVKIPPVMDTIVQQTYVSPAKLDLNKLDEDTIEASSKQPTSTATEQLAEQTAQLLDDIRKYFDVIYVV